MYNVYYIFFILKTVLFPVIPLTVAFKVNIELLGGAINQKRSFVFQYISLVYRVIRTLPTA